MSEGDWLSGTTAAGRSVRIPQDPYMTRPAAVFIDGEQVDVQGVSRYRDGGTTIIETNVGRVHYDGRIGRETHVHTLDGEPLLDDAKNPSERPDA